MGFYPGGLRLFLALGILCSTIFSFYGCTQLGPRSISRGRASYNEAITQTDNEQLLMSIVRGRYGETYNMLAITAVAANIRFSASANAQVGIGPSENYIGNLVPLSSGVAYEENPTITYAPAQGAEFLRQLHSPVPLETLILLIRNAKERPGKAWVAVKYRGYWFYIDETDQPTKRAFGAVSTMWQSSIAAGAEQQPAPILTLPVSR